MSVQSILSRIQGGGWLHLLALVATIAAVAILAVSAARLFWAVSIGPGAHIRIAPPVIANAGGPATLDYSILSRVTPFRVTGDAVVTADDINRTVDDTEFLDVEETSLDLKLHGLITENDDGGHAFISTDDGVQTAYAIGDEIDGTRGVTLERILTDSVLLRRDGDLESLTYGGPDGAITTLTAVDTLDPDAIVPEDGDPGDAPETSAIATVNRDSGAVEARSGMSPRPRADTGAAPEARSAEAEPTREQPSLPTIVRRVSRTDLETLALSIRLEENRSTGDGGLYVFPTGNIDVFARSGLEAGDIITDVAGLKLDSRADFDRLLQEVEQQRQISLEIIRGQDRRTLRVTIID